MTAVATRSSVKSTKTRHSSRLSGSVTSDTAEAETPLLPKCCASLKSEESSRGRGRPHVEQRRRSARKKLRLCVGDFLYSQGTFAVYSL